MQDVTKNRPDGGSSVETILSVITGIHVPPAQAKPKAWEQFWDKLDEALPAKTESTKL